MAKPGVHINVYKVNPTTWRCDIKINTTETGGGFTARGVADTMMGFNLSNAVGGALSMAKTTLKNPAIMAAFPMYALPALAAIEAIDQAAKKGVLSDVVKKFQDPALKKMSKEMSELHDGSRTAMSGGGCCVAGHVPKRKQQHHGARMRGEANPGFGTSTTPTNNRGPMGLPVGNPHPFAAYVQQQLQRGEAADPGMTQKLAAMTRYQRRLARRG
jgi:hypothetical protein